MIKKIIEITPAITNNAEEKVVENIKTLSITSDASGNIKVAEASSLKVTTTNVLKTRHGGLNK